MRTSSLDIEAAPVEGEGAPGVAARTGLPRGRAEGGERNRAGNVTFRHRDATPRPARAKVQAAARCYRLMLESIDTSPPG
ncbi:MAG TPA: hypothetical protein VGV85_03800 [Longimicrobiaceae bacterium]|nr:hypothetical protein [Longimicrobiaceae bacterium]